MQQQLLQYLRCPVTQQLLQLTVITTATKIYNGSTTTIISEGILTANEWCYPIIKGIPRMLIESFVHYESFLQKHLPDFETRKQQIHFRYETLIKSATTKNKHTQKSFEQEWNKFDYEKDTTWNAHPTEMLERFLRETDETIDSINNKLIFDAGCGNGLLDTLIANVNAQVLAMDFSLCVETAFAKNTHPNAWFIQGDVQHPPVALNCFDIVHCSGVLIHTNNPEASFACLVPTVKINGKLSVWLYHPRKNFLHNCFNWLRKYTSRLPLKLQYFLYLIFLFPPIYIIKKIKGNKQNSREMMIDLLDWLSPEFRWEITHNQATAWFQQHHFKAIKITTLELFGFNIIGTKQ
jgi:SAM-dependent methyltransferase